MLIFPNIESGNAFYKAVSLFAHADMAGLLQGPVCPVVCPRVVIPACLSIIALLWHASLVPVTKVAG